MRSTSLPADNDTLRKQIIEAIASQHRPTVTVLSSLLAIQDSIGYIPDEAIEEVAVQQNTTVNAVFGVASFYPNFRFTPPNKHSIEVCWGPTCHLQGSSNILQAVLNYLELKEEGDTEDGEFSFRFNTCLGACSQAPVISVNHELFGKISPDESINILNKIKSSDQHHK